MPTPVGGEVHGVGGGVCDSAGSQPRPNPVAAVTAANAPAVPATTPAHALFRAAISTANGTATSAVTLTATARPRSAPAARPQPASLARASPPTTKPAT